MKSKFFRILGVVTVLAMLVGTLAAPVLATVGVVTLSVSVTTISALSNYTVQYTSAADLAVGGTITVTMPTGATNLSAVTAALSGTSGIGSDAFLSVAATCTNTAGTQNLVVTVPAGINAQAKIGSAARVQIVFTGVRNPDSIGDFGVSVKTSTETTAVPSTTFTTTVPVIVTLPGIVKLYNASNILMYQNNAEGSILAAVGLVTGKNFVIELGPGLYDEITAINLTGAITIPVVAEGLTIKASGAKADTVVPVQWTVDAPSVKFTGLTMKPPAAPGYVIDILGNKATVDGCDFARHGTALSVSNQGFIIYDNGTADGTGTITNCTFDATLGAGQDYLVIVDADGLTVSKNKFLMDANGATSAALSDIAIHVDDGDDVVIAENTFTGASNFGVAIQVYLDNDEYILINKNTFTGVEQALYYDGGSYCDFTNNAVDASGNYSTTDVGLNDAPFVVDWTWGLSVVQNKITNSKYYFAIVNGMDEDVYFNFNELTGNAKGVNNTDLSHDVDATHNWWGTAAGPAADYNSDYVDVSAYLGAVPTNSKVVYDEEVMLGKSTTGVDVATFDDWDAGPEDADQMGMANYAATPGAAAPPSTMKVIKYYDVFIDDDSGVDYAKIKFYGTMNDFSEIWFYNAETMAWQKCSDQILVKTGGFISVDVGWWTTPDLFVMCGLPFVLVEAPPTAPVAEGVKQAPVLGAVNVPVDTTFTWPAVTGAVSYIFELAEETGQTDKFYLKDEVGGPTVNAYKLVDDLKYDVQYWWRVQAVNALGVKSAWTTSFFTTAKEVVVVEPLPPVVIQENPPAQITLEIPPDEEVVVEPIPSYLLWAVIAVGALLVIVVIVLIVRTRRIS